MAIGATGLYNAGFLSNKECIAGISEGPWEQHGQHFVSIVTVETSRRRFNLIQKAYYNSTPEGVIAYNKRTVRLYKIMIEGGAHVPRTVQYDDGLLVQTFIPGADFDNAAKAFPPEVVEKACRHVDEELALYVSLGLGNYPDHFNNFRVTPSGNVFLVDIDFPNAVV
ncbi:MAG: hypothetical protein HY513_01890 [Candidatus Aenigmarchaeota archaeon]|nr:hypothetical protein [Candidatus Aenigmarchaeota archaeon]